MRDRLPPLFSLQVFEAAARLKNFSKAASELNLTPGAISRQIRQLEAWCSKTLFERHGPRIELSQDGHDLLERLSAPLSALHMAVFPPQSSAIPTLHISTLASLAKSWLIPRLQSFQNLHPRIAVTLHTDYALVQPAPRIPMVILRHALPPRTIDSDMRCEVLFDDQLIAVAIPNSPHQWTNNIKNWAPRHVLRHQSIDVSRWFESADFPSDFSAQGMTFNDADVMLDAAENGLGIAITRLSLAWPRLKAGSLSFASTVNVPTERKNLLLYREDCADLPAVRDFIAWVKEQAGLWKAECCELQ